MTTVDKLVYLIRKGKVSLDRVAPQYREQVAAELGNEMESETSTSNENVQNREEIENG